MQELFDASNLQAQLDGQAAYFINSQVLLGLLPLLHCTASPFSRTALPKTQRMCFA